MESDLLNRGPADRTRVNLHEKHEVRYWTRAFGCTEQQLRDAVKRFGTMAADVREAVKRKA